MARPKRNNVDYFPHYISDGKKMFVIESKFGNDGYAVWFKILETLAKTDNHFINCNDESNLMYLAAKCKVSEDRLIEIIEAIVKLGEIDSILWKQCRVIWSDKFIESIQDAYAKRSNDCISKMALITTFRSLGIPKPNFDRVSDHVNPQNSPVKPQSKVEYSKEYERKGEYERTRDGIKDCLKALVCERGMSELDFPIDLLGDKFFDHYESKGWKINGENIVDWRARLSMWISEHLLDPSRILGKGNTKPETKEEEEARIFMQSIKDYNTHKTLYGEESANEKFKFTDNVQPNQHNNRLT